MDSSHRLAKTLSGLVVAMTSTAALLGWINPASSIAPSPTSLEELRDMARSAVSEGVDDVSGHWRDVSVKCVPNSTSGLLAAMPSSEEYHFYVDAAGQPTRTHRWRRQEGNRSGRHTIQVRVQAARDRAELSVAQTVTVRAIIESIDEFRSADHPPLRVVADSGSSNEFGSTTRFLGQRL